MFKSEYLNSGRPSSARTEENIALVQNMLQHNSAAVCCRRNGFGISGSRFDRIMPEALRWHPYQICLRHELTEGNFIKRVNFLEWFIRYCANPRFLTNLVVGDESAFALNGKLNAWDVS